MWKMTENEQKIIEKAQKMGKDLFYIGHYVSTTGEYVLKIGTTNDLRRRRTEHNQNYRKAKTHTLPPNEEFLYDWFIPLSKYNTLRIEDRVREAFQSLGLGIFVKNDRFVCDRKPDFVEITIRKTYKIPL